MKIVLIELLPAQPSINLQYLQCERSFAVQAILPNYNSVNYSVLKITYQNSESSRSRNSISEADTLCDRRLSNTVKYRRRRVGRVGTATFRRSRSEPKTIWPSRRLRYSRLLGRACRNGDFPAQPVGAEDDMPDPSMPAYKKRSRHGWGIHLAGFASGGYVQCSSLLRRVPCTEHAFAEHGNGKAWHLAPKPYALAATSSL